MFQVGDVIGVATAVRRKGQWADRFKLHVCVCASEGWYFYLNSEGHWPGSFPISKADNSFLDKDCFVGCGQLLEIDDSHFDSSKFLGQLSAATLRDLAQFIPTVEVLPDHTIEPVVSSLLDAADSIDGGVSWPEDE